MYLYTQYDCLTPSKRDIQAPPLFCEEGVGVGCWLTWFFRLFLPFFLLGVCMCMCAPGCIDGYLLRWGEVDESEALFDYMAVLGDGGGRGG